MKRSWFGLSLLLLILISALAVTWAMGALHKPIARDLELAAESALRENWDSAMALAEAAEAHWAKWDSLRRCFADHSPIEDIESNFVRLGAYGAEEETAEFAAACRELARKVEAMGDAHGLSLWNVL